MALDPLRNIKVGDYLTVKRTGEKKKLLEIIRDKDGLPWRFRFFGFDVMRKALRKIFDIGSDNYDY